MESTDETGYYIIPSWVIRAFELSSTQKIMLGAIITLSSNPRGYCFPTNDWFGHMFGISERTVSRHLSKLEETGYIEIEDREGGDMVRKIRPSFRSGGV